MKKQIRAQVLSYKFCKIFKNTYFVGHLQTASSGRWKDFSKRKIKFPKSVQIRSFSGLYFPVFGLNMRKYGPEKTPYLDSFHSVCHIPKIVDLRYV